MKVMRTIAEIEADIKSARSAYNSMSNLTGPEIEPEGKGIFLDKLRKTYS
jgi:hypothetical protein